MSLTSFLFRIATGKAARRFEAAAKESSEPAVRKRGLGGAPLIVEGAILGPLTGRGVSGRQRRLPLLDVAEIFADGRVESLQAEIADLKIATPAFVAVEVPDPFEKRGWLSFQTEPDFQPEPPERDASLFLPIDDSDN